MANIIKALSTILAAPAGSFTKLGAKRGFSMVANVALGRNHRVEDALDKNFARQQGRLAVSNAMSNGQFGEDWKGLHDLLAAAGKEEGRYISSLITDQAYRAALFDAAWNATVGRNGQALRDWKIRDETIHLGNVKRVLRSDSADGETRNTEKFIKGIAENGYLPRFEYGPNAKRERKVQDVADDLRSLTRLPKGIYASRGSNFRQYDEQSRQFLAPSTVEFQESFSIKPGNGVIALSFSAKGLEHCRNLNEALLTDHQAVELAEDEYGFIVREDHHVWAAAAPADRLRIMVLLPPTDTAEGVLDDLTSHPLGISLRENALVVAVSQEAAAALENFGPIPDVTLRAVFDAKNPAEMLQSAFTQMIARSTAATMKRRQEGLKALEQLGHLFKQIPPGRVPLRSHYIECVDTILAGIDDPQRIPKDVSVTDFGMLMKSMNDNAKALRERLTSPIGGDLLILAMSLDQAFPAKAPAQPPSAAPPVPPPLERTAETEFLFQDIGAEGEPLLKLKNQPTAPPAGGSSPMEIKNLSEDDSSTAESSGFDIDDYV